MGFHLGKPILVMAILSLLSGGVVLLRPRAARTDLSMWTFADSHATSYRGVNGTPRDQTPVGHFERESGLSVDIKLLQGNAENLRLGAMFDRAKADPDQPDVVEIEIGSIGRYFRGNLNDVGLMPLDHFLDRDGWRQQLVESRLIPWTKQGVVFGFPVDVHPVAIAYRRDLFEQAGIDLAAAHTWRAFADACARFQDYWHGHGVRVRHAIELPSATADFLIVMLQQQHLNLLDQSSGVQVNDPRIARTIAFYAQLVAGPRAIGTDATPGGGLWARDLAGGDLCAIMTPDWRAGYLKRYAPDLAGKIALIPLPVFDSSDAPTGTWGGTMGAIPKRCRDPEAAWKLMTFLFSDRAQVAPRWRTTMTLPAIKTLWDESVFHEPDPFFAGQKAGEFYISLARQIPPYSITPYTPLADAMLSSVLSQAIQAVRGGASEDALAWQVQAWLNDDAKSLQRRIDFGKLE